MNGCCFKPLHLGMVCYTAEITKTDLLRHWRGDLTNHHLELLIMCCYHVNKITSKRMRTVRFLQNAIVTFMKCPTYDFIKLFFFTQGFLRGDFLFKMRREKKKCGGRGRLCLKMTVKCWVTWKECAMFWTREGRFVSCEGQEILLYLIALGKKKEGNWLCYSWGPRL